MLPHPRIALLACLCLGLAACSGGPSDDDVRAALKARVAEAGADAGASIGEVDHINCYSRQGGAKYSCGFTAQMSMMGRTMKETGQLSMVKAGDGWTYEKGETLSMRPAQ